MRVTDGMLQKFILQSYQQARSSMLEASEQVTSGARVSRPSDDPSAAGRVLHIDRMLGRLDAMATSRNNVQLDLQLADTGIAQMEDIVSNTKALVLQMVNADKSAEDRAVAATTVQTSLATLLSLGNSQQADGHYIFGGIADQTTPYDSDGIYQGSLENRQVEVAPDVMVDGLLIGASALGRVDLDGDGTSEGNVFQVIQGVITALQNNDVEGIQSSLDTLDDVLGDLQLTHAAIGARLVSLADAETLGEDMTAAFLTTRANYADADLAAAATQVTAAQQSLALVGELGSQLLGKSLISFLG